MGSTNGGARDTVRRSCDLHGSRGDGQGKAKPNAITIGVLDNDGLLLDALNSLLRSVDPCLHIIWKTTQPDIAENRCLLSSSRPDVLLLDMSMPHENGVRVCRHIRMRTDRVAILGMSSYELTDYASALAHAGAQGLVSKVPVEGLVAAVHAVTIGKLYCAFPDAGFQTKERAFQRLRSQDDMNGMGVLSPKEATIMNLVLQGYSSENIATMLNCQSTTVRTHIGHAKKKLNALNLGQAAVRWMKLKEQW